MCAIMSECARTPQRSRTYVLRAPRISDVHAVPLAKQRRSRRLGRHPPLTPRVKRRTRTLFHVKLAPQSRPATEFGRGGISLPSAGSAHAHLILQEVCLPRPHKPSRRPCTPRSIASNFRVRDRHHPHAQQYAFGSDALRNHICPLDKEKHGGFGAAHTAAGARGVGVPR